MTGWPEELDLADFVGCVLYSDMEEQGAIETSDPRVNRLFLNALWGQRGNFLDCLLYTSWARSLQSL